MTFRSTFWIGVSIVVALLLTLLPLPIFAVGFRPEWLLLVVIYWSLAMPQRVNLGVAWISGLLLDTLQGSLLGEHALAFTLVAFVTVKLHRRMRFFPISQQALAVLGLMLLSQLTIFVIEGVVGQTPSQGMFWLPVLTSTLLWPWVFLVLCDWQKRFKIARNE